MVASSKISFLLLLCFVCFTGQAADSLTINHLTIRQGLSNNSVRAIFQDHSGFMWFGTYDGLNRYDGYEFKTFRNVVDDSGSLPHNYINAIGEDFHHNLVIGTGQGVSIYNGLTQKFTEGQYLLFGSQQKERINFDINSIKTDAKGNLYLATNGGGLLVKPDGSEVAIQAACAKNRIGECRNDIQSLVIDKEQKVWLLVSDAGLYQYIPSTHQLKIVSFQVQNMRCMEADDIGNLWIGGYDGSLYQYNIAQKQLTQLNKEQIKNTNSKSILTLAFDTQQHQLWIGTEGGGIYTMNGRSGPVRYFLPAKDAVSSETVYTIYQDRERRKWIGTHKGGIDIVDPQPVSFQTFTHDPLNLNSIPGNFIASFFEESSCKLWIGTDGGGVGIWDRTTGLFKDYHHIEGNTQSLSNNSIPSITGDSAGNIWIATFGGGINRYNKQSNTFQRYRCIIPETGAENNYVWKLLEDRQHNLWAATYANGHLYRLNRQLDRFEMFNREPADFFCLLEDHTGDLWAGSAFGLCRINRTKKSFAYFPITKPVRAIYEDRAGNFWLGTEGGGLHLFDRKSKKIIATYTSKDGLCNNSVLNILEDGQENLWLSTFHGLCRFQPSTKTFKNYYGEDGLQSNQFEYNAALKLQSGELVFGGIAGFSLFNPARLPVRTFNPPVILTDLRINNISVEKGSSYIKDIDSDGIVSVKIPYNEAVLSFDFAALEYSSPSKISYAYYLEGWDKDWNYTSNLRTANYTKLGDGTYTLHIKATNAEGVWNPREVRLKAVVLPPWYRSWWAYLLYIGMVAGFIYLYNGYRVRRANLEYELKLAQVQRKQEKELAQLEIQQEKELAEKEKQLAQLEIQTEKELAEKKLTFFTDVSHEFRTPLTLIINPLKDYLESDKPQEKKELNGVYRNARRLLTLVDQLLQFRKAGEDADTLRIVKLDFCDLCQEVFASFDNAAAKKHLAYRFTCASEKVELYADREKMEVVLYNLLSNAVKFTPFEGEIEMQVVEKEETVEVKLTDNGQGIPAEVGNKLFERFYRVESDTTPSKPGFGIGLYLVKHFVEKHKGEITYESSLGTGTVFCLSFKKGLAHLAGLPVYEDKVTPAEPLLLQEAEEVLTVEPENNGLDDLISSRKSILIVEDNEEIRDYVGSIFKERFTVHKAESGKQGLEVAKQYLPDIIISDVMMEGGNGIELCSAIKSDPSLGHIPVILLTALSDDDVRLKGTQSGADDYVTKPFDKELLLARVNALLNNRTRLQQYFYNEVTLKKQEFGISEEYREFLNNCIEIIEKHLHDEDFSIKKLSQMIGMSHSALFRKVKSMSGQSVIGFIRFIRLRKAAELMIHSTDTISQIAFEVGMNDAKYFRKQFQVLFGMNPSEYIKKFRRSTGSML